MKPSPAEILILLATTVSSMAAGPCDLRFADETTSAGFDFEHGFAAERPRLPPFAEVSGGVAAGDYDADGDIDLYVVRGDVGANLLFRNRGDGTFDEVGAEAGVALEGGLSSGPVFADYDGDGRLDLFVGAVDVTQAILFRGLGDGTFENANLASGLHLTRLANVSGAFSDIDRDGDLDLYVSHWGTWIGDGLEQQLWRNEGEGRFVDVTGPSGIAETLPRESPAYPLEIASIDFTFAPTFADIDADGWPDLLVTADFSTSHVLRNRRDGSFEDITSESIDDENGMGAAVGDFDNDCDLDWLVTSIYDPNGGPEPGQGYWGASGNRLYRNDGRGHFEDVSLEAGVREGGWGWGACFADFDNDGHLDVFHVNGWFQGAGFQTDPTRLFLSQGDGTFVEQAAIRGVDDDALGRGVACFDGDRDGDLDVFVANLEGPPRYYRNALIERGSDRHWLGVRLAGPPGNTQGIGARVVARTRLGTQLREIRAGSRFASQDPAEAHFGLGAAQRVESVEVSWPDGSVSVRRHVRADRLVVIDHAERLRGAAARLARRRLGCPLSGATDPEPR